MWPYLNCDIITCHNSMHANEVEKWKTNKHSNNNTQFYTSWCYRKHNFEKKIFVWFISYISSNNNNSSSKASLDLISHPLGWQFQIGIYLTNFQVKTNQIFFFPASHCQANFENIMHQFAIHFSSMEFEFNSSCMQSHSIFSFKWNLIFTKSIHYFH